MSSWDPSGGSGGGPAGPVGGDLAGSYPNPTVVDVIYVTPSQVDVTGAVDASPFLQSVLNSLDVNRGGKIILPGNPPAKLLLTTGLVYPHAGLELEGAGMVGVSSDFTPGSTR